MKMQNERKIEVKRNLKIQGQKGITLLVLVVTIIVLLIFAGITIGALTGENGIINNTKNAKEETEIANEKEIVENATVEAMGKNKYGNIEESELQSALNKEAGDGKTIATEAGEEFEVLFKDSNRYYTVDKDGNVGEMQEYYQDKNPGDITIGENGQKLDGNTKDTAYQIWCIEDLVAFSNMVNGEGIRLENGEPVIIIAGSIFSGKYIVLKRDLNFKSKLSYADSERTDFGDINGNTEDGNSLIDEMTTGTGFISIAKNGNKYFEGSFDGEDHKIDNIYINSTDNYASLFGRIANNAIIENLQISGEMKSDSNLAGGIIATVYNNERTNSKNK